MVLMSLKKQKSHASYDSYAQTFVNSKVKYGLVQSVMYFADVLSLQI